MKTAAVMDDNGNKCTTPESQQNKWRVEGTSPNFLIIQSEFDTKELMRARQRPQRPEMAETSSVEEARQEVAMLKNERPWVSLVYFQRL